MSAIAIGIFRTKIVVIATLPPIIGQQGGNRCGGSLLNKVTCSLNQFPLAGNGFVSVQMIIHAILDLFDKILQIGLHLNRDVFHIEMPLLRITKDRCGAIVGSHDYKAFWRVEHIESCIIVSRLVGGDPMQAAVRGHFHGRVRVDELSSYFTGLSYINWIGLRSQSEREQKDHEGEALFSLPTNLILKKTLHCLRFFID